LSLETKMNTQMSSMPIGAIYTPERIAKLRSTLQTPHNANSTTRRIEPVDLNRLRHEFLSNRPARPIKISELHVDNLYQRHGCEVEMEKAERAAIKIIRHFDLKAFGKICVAKRRQGKHSKPYVVDGVHRTLVAMVVGASEIDGSDTFDSTGPEDESIVFNKRNFDRRNVDRVTRHKNDVLSGDANAVLLNQVCGRAGVVLQTGNSPGYAMGVDLLTKTMLSEGPESLELGLRLVRETFPASSVSALLATAYTFLAHAYPALDQKRMVKQIASRHPAPEDLINATSKMPANQRHGRAKAMLIAILLIDRYNSKLSRDRRLDSTEMHKLISV
jgi:hypothetical protein